MGFTIHDVVILPSAPGTSGDRFVSRTAVVPSRDEPTTTAFLSLFLRIAAVCGVLACGAFSTTAYVWVTVAAIALLTVFGLRRAGKDSRKLEIIGDQAYFLGYLCAISAFAGMLLHAFVRGKMLEEPSLLLTMAGVALISTVSGLVSMTVLKQIARRHQDAESTAELAILIVAELVYRQIDNIGVVLSEMSGSSEQTESPERQLASSIERLKTLAADINEPLATIEDLRRTLELIQNQVKQLSEQADRGRSSAELMSRRMGLSVIKIQSVSLNRGSRGTDQMAS